jgi:hypothetical protein
VLEEIGLGQPYGREFLDVIVEVATLLDHSPHREVPLQVGDCLNVG